MLTFKEAMEKIEGIECATGDVKDRVAEVLSSYGWCDKNEVTLERHKELDNEGAQAYVVRTSHSTRTVIPPMVIFIREGMDGYVAKIVETDLH